jgi:signal transduction histidine kinase/ligand-binding sensor domain-containing protein
LKSLARLIFVLLTVAGSVNAQPYYFRHFQVESGLSNNSVFCSAQDKNGFVWFGTKDGLNRFDGYRFKTFNINADDESSLERDLILSIATDQNGTLWVGTQKGLYRFDANKERLVPFIDTLYNINDVYIDSKNQLWFISALAVYHYNFNTKQLIRVAREENFAATSLFELNRTLWVSSHDGFLYKLDLETKRSTSYDVFAHSPSPSSRWIEKIFPGDNGSIFIGTSSQGIKQFDIASEIYQDLLSYNPDKTSIFVRDIIKVAEQEFWFATESGIFILNAATNKFTNLKKKYLDPYSLSDNAVYTLHKDHEGGIWAGTYFGGVNYFPRQFSSFQKYFPDYSKNSISGSAVREICEDNNGNLWIGTEDAGLNKMNRATGQFTRFEPTGASTSIAYSNIHGLLVDGNDLWIGTFEHGLDIMDIKTGKVKKRYKAGPGDRDLKHNFIVTMLKTKTGDIYLGTGNALHRYDRKLDNFVKIDLFDNLFVSSLLEDHTGTIWVGTHSSGVLYFNPETNVRGHLMNDPANKNSLTTNTINALFEDSFQNLWIATEGGGLCQLDKARKKITRFTIKNGLPSNFIFKVLEDNQQSLWITTSKGLVNFNASRSTPIVYTKANGLLNDQFNYNSGYKDEEGRLYFGSVRGMITFTPGGFYQNKFIAPVFITGFQVHNKEVEIRPDSSILKKSILYTDEITLPYDQSSFSIDFTALSFTSPEMTEYSYIMEGLDKEWIHLKSNRKVYFTNLEPGSYTFKVRATSNGLPGGERSLDIEVLPPFWATPWAYLVYIIVSGSLLYYLIRTYHNMQENKKEKEIYEAKIEFFTNIAHEIRTPLTLIKGPVENLSEIVDEVPAIKDDVKTMERNTDRLVNLINQILDFRQTETKGFSLDFTSVNINSILQEAYLTFEPVARKRKLEYSMQLPSSNVYLMADDEALVKIFTNLFSNAVKYAERKVSIRLIQPEKEDKYLSIEIRNDGYIIPDEMKQKIFEPFYRLKQSVKQKGTGIGLALTKSLVELHKGDIYLVDPEDGMNVFVLELPYVTTTEKKKTQHSEMLN